MQTQESLTFEKVWALVQETNRSIKELRNELRDELRESQRETDRQMKETAILIGKLGNSFGALAEHLVVPNIMEKFNALGFDFTHVSNGQKIKESGNPNTLAEVDIMLENGDIAIAVEVKAKAKRDDVDEHVQRMEVLRQAADRKGDKRKFLGAVAVAIMSDDIRNYIIKNGFYAIEQTGDTVKIVVPEGFTPREW